MRDAFGVSKGLPPYGHVPGIGRVKINGMPHKDIFDVTDSKDVRRMIPRARLAFVKSKKISQPSAGMGAAQMLRPKPRKKVLKPKYTQPALFDTKGRINPNAKP